MKKFLKKIGSVAAITACLGYGLPLTCCVWGMDSDTETVQYSFVSEPDKDNSDVKWLEQVYAVALYDKMKKDSGNVLCYLSDDNLFVELHSGFYTKADIIDTWTGTLSELMKQNGNTGCLVLTAADVLLLSVEGAQATPEPVNSKVFRLNWKQNDLAFRALSGLNNIGGVTDAEAAEFLLTCLKAYLDRLTEELRRTMVSITCKSPKDRDLLVLGLGDDGNASESLKLIDCLKGLLRSEKSVQNAIDCTFTLLGCLTGVSDLDSGQEAIGQLIASNTPGKLSKEMETKIKDALRWMNYAFHTEAQCMVLHNAERFHPIMSPLISLYNPCISCQLLPYIIRSKDTSFFEFLCVDNEFAKTVGITAQKIDSKVPLTMTRTTVNMAARGVDSLAHVSKNSVSRFSGNLIPWSGKETTIKSLVATMKDWPDLSKEGQAKLSWCQRNDIHPLHLKSDSSSGIKLNTNGGETNCFRVYDDVTQSSDYKTRCLDRVQSALHTEGSSTQIKEILLRGMVLRSLKGNVSKALGPIRNLVAKTTAYNRFKDPKSDVVYRDTAYSCTEEILNMNDVTSAQLTNFVNEYLSELRKDNTIDLQFLPIEDNKGIGLGDAIASAFSINIIVYDTWLGREDNSHVIHKFSSNDFSSNPESPNEKTLMFRDKSGRFHRISIK